jgi:hypothetical protein
MATTALPPYYLYEIVAEDEIEFPVKRQGD